MAWLDVVSRYRHGRLVRPVSPAEGLQTAFGTDSGPGKHDDAVHGTKNVSPAGETDL